MTDEVKIILIGASGNTLEAIDAICAMRETGKMVSCAGILDDNPEIRGTVINGFRVLGSIDDARNFETFHFVLGIGSARSFKERYNIIRRIQLPLSRYTGIVHPSAVISPHAKVGLGSIILANVVVGARANIGCHTLILPNSTINHDCVIGNYSCIGSHVCVSGGVQVKDSTYLGSASSILSNISIGEGALVGLGAVVIRDVLPHTVVVGNPAHPIKCTR